MEKSFGLPVDRLHKTKHPDCPVNPGRQEDADMGSETAGGSKSVGASMGISVPLVRFLLTKARRLGGKPVKASGLQPRLISLLGANGPFCPSWA